MTQHQSLPTTYTRPGEAGPHQLTVLCWPGAEIAYLDERDGMRAEVNATISAVADAVARFEPVRLLVDERHFHEAQRRFPTDGILHAHPVEVCVVKTGCSDLWMRDIAPTFTKGANGVLYGVDFNFNGWG